jgi:hypothetical protein
MPHVLLGGVPVEAVDFCRLPNEGTGDWSARAWSFTAVLESDSEAAAVRAALQDSEPRKYRRMINGSLRGGPLITCAGDLLGESIAAGVEIGIQPTNPIENRRRHTLFLTLREAQPAQR